MFSLVFVETEMYIKSSSCWDQRSKVTWAFAGSESQDFADFRDLNSFNYLLRLIILCLISHVVAGPVISCVTCICWDPRCTVSHIIVGTRHVDFLM